MALWFLDTRIEVRVSCEDGADGISILENTAPHGDSPPLHVHAGEDEAFYVLEGELRLAVDGDERVLGAGEAAVAPKGSRHSYRVESAEGARWLVTTTAGDFERFVRTISRPAEGDGLPAPAGPDRKSVV